MSTLPEGRQTEATPQRVAHRQSLRQRALWAVAALDEDQANDPYQRRVRKRSKRGGRPTKVGANYAEHRKVERTFAWLGNFRRLLVRHAYYLSNFRGFFLLAFVLLLPLPYPLCRFDPDPAGVS